MSVRSPHAAATIIVAITVMMVLISGCDSVSSIKNDGVSNPMTPEQSKAQVIDAANEIVSTLNLKAIEPAFWHASCNDQGDPPFRGQMMIGYANAASFEASDAEIAEMVQRLQTKGWTTDPGSHTHGTALKKNEVVAVFGPQNASDSTRSLQLFGECRDVTTTKDSKGSTQIVTLATP